MEQQMCIRDREYKDYEIKFTVSGNVLQVTDIRTADRRE